MRLRDLPPREGACRLALARLDAAVAARTRLDDPKDDEALHDFRVALRRLRSVLRAYRPWLDDVVPPKLRKHLRKLARATNEARDAEVMLVWLDGRRRRLTVAERAGYAWLRARLEARRDEGYAHTRQAVAEEFAVLERRLRKRFVSCAAEAAPAAKGENFGGITRDLIGRHHEALTDALGKIGSVQDAGAVHAARIAGKRLRYLLEPVADEITGGVRSVTEMKAFQDRFGELCDAYVRNRELLRAVETVGGDLARGRLEKSLGLARGDTRHAGGAVLPGLFALARRARADTQRRFAEVGKYYLGERAARLLAGIGRAGKRRAARPGAAAKRKAAVN